MSFTIEVEPEGAALDLSWVLDFVLATGGVGDEITLPQYMLGAVDLDSQFTLQHKAIFETLMGDRMLRASGMRCVFVDGDRDTAGAVFAQQPADDMFRGLDGARLRCPHHDPLFTVRPLDQQLPHPHPPPSSNPLHTAL